MAFVRGYVFLFDDLLVLTKPKKSGGDTSRIYSLVDAHPLAGFTVSVHFEPPSGYGEGTHIPDARQSSFFAVSWE